MIIYAFMTCSLYVYHMFEKNSILKYACFGQDLAQVLNGYPCYHVNYVS